MTVSGGGLSRVFQVDAGVTATISGLTITGGNTVNGGGLYNDNGTATLTNCTVSGNPPYQGGRRPVQPQRHPQADQLHGERKLQPTTGGGLYNLNGTATLTDCTVSRNSAA